MAHRLPSAGIPTPQSEHFEFFRVHPMPCRHTRSAGPSCQPWENNFFLRPRFIAFDGAFLRILTQKKQRRGSRRQERTARPFSSEPADVIMRRNACFCCKLRRTPAEEGTGMFGEQTCPVIPPETAECCDCPAPPRPASRIASDVCCKPVTQSKAVKQKGTRPNICHMRSAPISDDIEQSACPVAPSICQSCRPVVKARKPVCCYLPPSPFDTIYNIPVLKLDTRICQPFYGRRKTEFEHLGIC